MYVKLSNPYPPTLLVRSDLSRDHGVRSGRSLSTLKMYQSDIKVIISLNLYIYIYIYIYLLLFFKI